MSRSNANERDHNIKLSINFPECKWDHAFVIVGLLPLIAVATLIILSHTCTCSCVNHNYPMCHSDTETGPNKKIYNATGKGLYVAVVGEIATADLHIYEQQEKTYSTAGEIVTCELVPALSGYKTECSAMKIHANLYEISYQPTSQGEHQLHITVDGEHINNSPFAVTVLNKFGDPVTFVSGVTNPQGIASNQRGDIIVVEYSVHPVSYTHLTLPTIYSV